MRLRTGSQKNEGKLGEDAEDDVGVEGDLEQTMTLIQLHVFPHYMK